MKHFFPFLAIPFILCLLLHLFPEISVSAQQHNSFASAKYLSLDQSVSIILPANASEYYYFSSFSTLNRPNSRYQITISGTTSLSISAYDDQGSALHLTETAANASDWTGCIRNAPDSTRFFLMLHNQTKQDLSLRLSVKALRSHSAVTSKNSNNAKKAATEKPNRKSRRTSRPKAAAAHHSPKQPKRTQKPKVTATPVYSEIPRQKSFRPKVTITQSPPPDQKSENTSSKNTAASQSPEPSTTEYQFDHTTNHSRSDFMLSKHFFRITAGRSISAFELLSIDPPDNEIKLESLTPKTILLQDNIIYAKTSGLAVIRIYCSHYTTSCTVYIQDPP